MKTLIIYYSDSEKTKIVAETLSVKLDGDLIQIEDKKNRSGFKNRLTSSIDALRENKTEISPKRVDVSDYDVNTGEKSYLIYLEGSILSSIIIFLILKNSIKR